MADMPIDADVQAASPRIRWLVLASLAALPLAVTALLAFSGLRDRQMRGDRT